MKTIRCIECPLGPHVQIHCNAKINSLQGNIGGSRCPFANPPELEYDPYWYWPQCDVEGCEGVSCAGGVYWNDTGRWSTCREHSEMARNGEPQPKMKDEAIKREASRDKKTGHLPCISKENGE